MRFQRVISILFDGLRVAVCALFIVCLNATSSSAVTRQEFYEKVEQFVIQTCPAQHATFVAMDSDVAKDLTRSWTFSGARQWWQKDHSERELSYPGIKLNTSASHLRFVAFMSSQEVVRSSAGSLVRFADPTYLLHIPGERLHMWNVNLQRYLTSVDLYDCVSLGVDKGLMGLCNERWVDEFVEAGRYFYQSKEFISRLAAFDTAVEECMEEGVK